MIHTMYMVDVKQLPGVGKQLVPELLNHLSTMSPRKRTDYTNTQGRQGLWDTNQ